MKNIVICCDGTHNQLDGEPTNVVRMFQVAAKNDRQVVFYDPGVGTMASTTEKTWLGKRWSMLQGLAFGAGLDDNVFDAYRYLMAHYQDGDRIFLFGFSRGAFTIRVLAGMLHGVGLLNAGSENLLPYVWRQYLAIHILPPDATPDQKAAAQQHAAEIERLKRSFTRPCPVAFLGPWDTVGSVGMYNMNQAFPHTFENSSVTVVRHAVSLDERRAGFRSNVFKADPTPSAPNGRPRVMNVWFPGVHSDIGGGYPFAESGLAMIAFTWMIREAKQAGLLVEDPELARLVAQCPPDSKAKMHESLTGAWKTMEYLPARRYDWKLKKTIWRCQPNKPRTMVEAPFLHRSVLDRSKVGLDYHPPNLKPEDLNGGYPIED